MELKVPEIDIYSDSQLMVYQILGEYQTHGEKMTAYYNNVKEFLEFFASYSLQQIPQSQNTHADALAKLASTKSVDLFDVVSIEFLANPSITAVKEDVSQMRKPQS